ncbi:mitochondrial fission factor-like isoform X4 [Ptychodera flava]|uniref:mitochondrial fission factor-like isoform X4 n=1 Tax=Ptychodera flava TaxID=63121 RepID=UPI00396A49FE
MLIMEDSSMHSSFSLAEMEKDMEELQMLSYSAEYSKDINMKMRVPDKISVSGDEGGDVNGVNEQHAVQAADMLVPDRILVGGDAPVGLTTPPRVIKLEEHGFPSIETNPPNSSRSHSSANRSVANDSNVQSNDISLLSGPNTGDEDLQLLSIGTDEDEIIEEPVANNLPELRYQVAKLSRRVLILEAEQAQRSQKEFIFVSLTLSYMAFKAVRFIYRHW